MAVVDLQQVRDARAEEAWAEYVRAKTRADATRTLRDMAVAVRAFDAFCRAAGLTDAEREGMLR
ncbi:hypothetical protein [Methylobacterium oxalidis]|uniref:hypothetical protein n=1 Tax=Methylobacterium oxalidis TaxID=944322 RepID=UPI0011BD552F|nr:hypothetical protein [Methylobacterium oxalidis]GJE33537.1 hypothetical protein LDDCCGHA_3737 [Methylobacterium oxalidis]